MQNHGLGMDNDKICVDTATKNTPNTLQFVWPICPSWPKYLGYD